MPAMMRLKNRLLAKLFTRFPSLAKGLIASYLPVERQESLNGFEQVVRERLRERPLDPELLFFDEPSAGLDPVTAAGLDELIIKLRNVFKMTIVVVTHELPSIFTIADYVIMLDLGEVLFAGPLDGLRASDHPRIRMFLERKPEEETYSPADYFRFIAGN